jgi:hypothetical protein
MARFVGTLCNRAIKDVRAGEETCREKSPPGRDVGRIAAGRGHRPESAAFALELLNKIRPKAASAERLRDVHV